jgi:hypothetical protein
MDTTMPHPPRFVDWKFSPLRGPLFAMRDPDEPS